MAPARAGSLQPQVSERLMLIPAINKNSTTGYKCVTFNRKLQKFEVQAQAGGKRVFLGSFGTAEEAATAYARSEYGRADAAKILQPRAAPTAAGAEVIRQAEREGLTLTASSSSNTGYKGVTFYPKMRGSKKYQLHMRVGGKKTNLGVFATAEQAALFYARREAGRDTSDLTAPPPPPPPPAPSSAAGAEAVRQAKRESLTLATSSSSNSGYKGVTFKLKRAGRKKYQLKMMVGGKKLYLGNFATAEEAALARARHLWDTTVRLLEPQPQQEPPQGAAEPSEASYEEEEDGFDPADIADAVAHSLLPDPRSTSEQLAARRQARAAEQAARADAAAGAAAQAAAEAAPPWDDEVEVEAEQESDSEEESEMEVEAAAAVAGVSVATAAEEEALECAICLDDLSAHPEARLQSRGPNGWGATRCCKSLFHYRCLHTWLSNDSEVETSRGMEPINTACPGCRGFVPKSKSRMLS